MNLHASKTRLAVAHCSAPPAGKRNQGNAFVGDSGDWGPPSLGLPVFLKIGVGGSDGIESKWLGYFRSSVELSVQIVELLIWRF